MKMFTQKEIEQTIKRLTGGMPKELIPCRPALEELAVLYLSYDKQDKNVLFRKLAFELMDLQRYIKHNVLLMIENEYDIDCPMPISAPARDMLAKECNISKSKATDLCSAITLECFMYMRRVIQEDFENYLNTKEE